MVNSKEKDVEDVLMRGRVCRRRPGDVPYPVKHNGASSSMFDIWNTMFRAHSYSHTTHQFEAAPTVVLDLGCGSGYWAIETAKQWKSSTIVGFDIKNIQPRLSSLEHHKDLVHRVKWVHGNLLDGLPFSSGLFDFVRIVNIGLGVPEDEWQFVLEEVARVMKSGGVVEVIEEDPIFPCAHPSQQRDQVIFRPSPISVGRRPHKLSLPTLRSSRSTTTLFSDTWSTTLDERFELSSPASSFFLNSVATSPSSPHPVHSENDPYLLYASSKPSISEPNRHPDLRDHSKLKAAWNAMLSSRWIAANPLSVLPFYMSSSFIDVQSHPPLKVLLPPNSEVESNLSPINPTWSSTESFLDSIPSYSGANGTCLPSSDWSSESRSDPNRKMSYGDPYTTERASMHLAHTVHTVTGCKEAIWQEYKKLYDADVMISPATTRSTPRLTETKSSIRESFDDEWASWQNDMTDRIGMRMSLTSQFGWAEALGDHADWRTWRSMVAKAQQSEKKSGSSYEPSIPPMNHTTPDVCRSMRAFVGFKP